MVRQCMKSTLFRVPRRSLVPSLIRFLRTARSALLASHCSLCIVNCTVCLRAPLLSFVCSLTPSLNLSQTHLLNTRDHEIREICFYIECVDFIRCLPVVHARNTRTLVHAKNARQKYTLLWHTQEMHVGNACSSDRRGRANNA